MGRACPSVRLWQHILACTLTTKTHRPTTRHRLVPQVADDEASLERGMSKGLDWRARTSSLLSLDRVLAHDGRVRSKKSKSARVNLIWPT